MTRGTRIAVLARPPRRGETKTRLAAGLGPGAAARLARAFLADTWAGVSAWVSSQPDVDLVFAQAGNPEDFPQLLPTPTIVRQAEGDLGRRMATLVAGALGQRAQVLLLGTDSPSLPEGHLAAAVAALAGADVVLGPAQDGGFWCLGVRGGPAALWGNTWLDELRWDADSRGADGAAAPGGTSESARAADGGPAPAGTFEQVRERLRRMGLTVALAPEWYDVDVSADLVRLRADLVADPDRAPATLALLPEDGPPGGPSPLTAIVATLDENVALDACLEALRRQPGALELIVADGGSRDRSPDRAVAAGATVTVTSAGRGRQFAAGARLATGDVLLFLHADARLPENGTTLLREALASGREAGAFVTRTVADPGFPDRAGPLLRLADLRSRLTRHPYGDQALFVTRAAYEAVGGFRALPIMEDYDLSRRLAARGPLARIRTPVVVSGRRMQAHPLRALLLMRLIPPLYRLGVDPVRLVRMYRRW
ncbi:MAG TPA: TIGR04283 family arsenosugar biosynthesis glycosyltransferase [Planctomycetota bacterium]|nr:TIGR04283 family arsenosugar biosynthesis glycosyltransferase [Planctomycetota bacterium]